MTQHRNSITVQIKAQDSDLLPQCVKDKSLRVMVFCAAQDSGLQDIAFPHQSELKVNGDDIKANLRGLKNKPGSTRPVDITDHLRLNIRPYANNVEFTYALTSKASVQTPLVQVSPGEIMSCHPARFRESTLTVQSIHVCSVSILSSTSAEPHPSTAWSKKFPRRKYPRTRLSRIVRFCPSPTCTFRKLTNRHSHQKRARCRDRALFAGFVVEVSSFLHETRHTRSCQHLHACAML